MVNGPVRTIAQSGDVVWLGGAFTQISGPAGSDPVRVANLVPLDDRTGALDTSVHTPSVTLAGGQATVFDLSLGPDGVLYLAGSFSSVDGLPRQNVAAINPQTGTLLPFAPHTAPAKSVLATRSQIFVGAKRLLSFTAKGKPTPGFTPPVAAIDTGLRGHGTLPEFRDIAIDANMLVAACECDRMTDRHGTAGVRAIVEIDVATGDLRPWAPAGLPSTSGAFGIAAVVHTDAGHSVPTIYLAAGGSDFTAAYDAASGAQRWRTDTSGSSQALAWYQGDLVVGGHFDWTQRPGSGSCGTNAAPNAACYHSPRLVAMDPANGHVVLDEVGDPWNPGICCKYNGVWALLPDAGDGSLHVGGEFSRMGGSWYGAGQSWTLKDFTAQDNYGRLSDGESPTKVLEVTNVGSGSGRVGSIPSGILCPNACEARFENDTKVTLVGTAITGSVFSGWSGDCSGMGECKLKMDRIHHVTATFTLSSSSPLPTRRA
jgi:hypothetical protein